MTPTSLTMPFRIHVYEVDHRGVSKLQAICNYLQEIASMHAEKLGFGYQDMLQQNTAWVLVRLSMRMQRYPRWQNTIEIKTWPSGMNNFYAFRDFKIFDSNHQEIGKATSQWAVIHFKKNRLVKLTNLHIPLNIHHNREYQPEIEKIPTLEEANWKLPFTVRKSDLDLNIHVNNVKYIEWALEAIPMEKIEHQDIHYFDIVFRNATFYGEKVVSSVQIKDSDTYIHQITKEKVEVARALSRWSKLH